MPTHAEAMVVAWEQCCHWQTYMPLTEAADLLGVSGTNGWETVAKRLARLWLDLHQSEFARAA
jgi:hypothetical protein